MSDKQSNKGFSMIADIDGDFNRVTIDEVMKLAEGDGSGRVQR